ncbi:MAG: hypothetical protein ACRCXA_08845 [Peptostreptococcaceae bacterium]
MLKKFLNLIIKKKNTENIGDSERYIEIDIAKEKLQQDEDDCINENLELNEEIKKEVVNDTNNKNLEEQESKLEKFLEDNKEYITEIKIRREKGIRAVDLYNEEVLEFNNYKECSKKLKVPMSYIKENLKYGYTDYLGEAINYLKEELGEVVESKEDYLSSNKTPIELFNNLNNRIFKSKIPKEKREEILSSEKIEPLKMHYKFECIDVEYDDYFKIYGAIIKRGGNKKIELLNSKGEVVEVFRTLDICAKHLKKDKNEITDMLKCGYSKVGRYEIRYSLRNI